ncbi:MAG: hypothetical protein P8M63_14920 [Paracoccaceae bacterium]|nr:hypothetical protein [Paracoccaceae bacterium]
MGQQFEFDLVFGLPRKDLDQDAILDALFEAGCEDAVVGLGARGLVGLAFTRSGDSAEEVIAVATKTARSALPEDTILNEVK